MQQMAAWSPVRITHAGGSPNGWYFSSLQKKASGWCWWVSWAGVGNPTHSLPRWHLGGGHQKEPDQPACSPTEDTSKTRGQVEYACRHPLHGTSSTHDLRYYSYSDQGLRRVLCPGQRLQQLVDLRLRLQRPRGQRLPDQRRLPQRPQRPPVLLQQPLPRRRRSTPPLL